VELLDPAREVDVRPPRLLVPHGGEQAQARVVEREGEVVPTVTPGAALLDVPVAIAAGRCSRTSNVRP
jgi:hypothetical protein